MLSVLSIFLIILLWEVHVSPSASYSVLGKRVKVSVDSFSGTVRLVSNNLQSVELCGRDGKLFIQKVASDANTYEECYGTSYMGLFGVFKMPAAYCIALIASSVPISTAPIKDVHAIGSVHFIKIPQVSMTQDQTLQAKQSESERLLSDILKQHSFLFSSSGVYDVTKPLQANVLDSTESSSPRLRCDDRFFWNYHCNKVFLDLGLDSFVTPVTNAFVTSQEILCGENVEKYQLTLISRRNRHRQGPRYIKRGSDAVGNVANFVETEQIVQSEDGSHLSSFVQVRGSIPLLWVQPSSALRRRQIPSLTTTDMMSQVGVLKMHLRELCDKYCRQPTVDKCGTTCSKAPAIYFINLIDKVSKQGVLGSFLFQTLNLLSSLSSSKSSALQSNATSDEGEAGLKDRDVTTWKDFLCTTKKNKTNTTIKSNNDSNKLLSDFLTRYIWFDYHHRCKDGDFGKCRDLLPLLLAGLDGTKGGFFSAQFPKQGAASPSHPESPWVGGTKQMRLQNCIVRTNCMDCLDRTNVMQSMISLWVLEKQLMLLNPSWKTANSELFIDTLRRMWTLHGDHLSELYAGSRAMKREVTKTGKETYRGAVNDAFSFCRRYLMNNYYDADKQRGLDILLGNNLQEV